MAKLSIIWRLILLLLFGLIVSDGILAFFNLRGPFFEWLELLGVTILLLLISSFFKISKIGLIILMVMLFTTSFLKGAEGNLMAIFFGLGAYYWAWRSWPIFAGLFLGAAVVLKPAFLIGVAPGVFLLILWNYLPASKKEISKILGLVKPVLLLAISFLVVWVPLTYNAYNADKKFPDFFVYYAHNAQSTLPMTLGTLSPLILAFLPLMIFYGRRALFNFRDNFLNNGLKSLKENIYLKLIMVILVGTVPWIFLQREFVASTAMLTTLLLGLIFPVKAVDDFLSRFDFELVKVGIILSVISVIIITLYSNLILIKQLILP